MQYRDAVHDLPDEAVAVHPVAHCFSLRELRFLVASHFQPDRPVEQREELSDEVVRGMLWVRRLARIIQVALRYMYQ